MKSMRAAVFRGVNDIRVEEVPIPRPRSDEVVMRVTFFGCALVGWPCDPQSGRHTLVAAICPKRNGLTR